MSDPRGPHDLTRRELLASALVLPLAGAIGRQPQPPAFPDIAKSRYRVVGGPDSEKLVVTREWLRGGRMVCRSRVSNPYNLRIGTVELPGKRLFCCFNWADTPGTLVKKLYKEVRVTDFWTGEPLGRLTNRLTLENMPPHSARLLEAVDG